VQSAASTGGEKHAVNGTEAFEPIWIVDFPMFEYDLATQKWMPAHHPFTAPHEADMANLAHRSGLSPRELLRPGHERPRTRFRLHPDPSQRRAAADLQSLGISDQEARARFGFFLDALEYAPPPHGGIALGLDRIVMLLAGAASLREV